jgi:hypothetical protein
MTGLINRSIYLLYGIKLKRKKERESRNEVIKITSFSVGYKLKKVGCGCYQEAAEGRERKHRP